MAQGKESDPMDPEALRRVLKDVPRGALALVGPLLVVMVVAWLLVYFLLFLPRGVPS